MVTQSSSISVLSCLIPGRGIRRSRGQRGPAPAQSSKLIKSIRMMRPPHVALTVPGSRKSGQRGRERVKVSSLDQFTQSVPVFSFFLGSLSVCARHFGSNFSLSFPCCVFHARKLLASFIRYAFPSLCSIPTSTSTPLVACVRVLVSRCSERPS